MARKKNDKIYPHAGATSTKDLPGKRVGGVVYLKKGVGTGCFSNINPNTGSDQNKLESSQITPTEK